MKWWKTRTEALPALEMRALDAGALMGLARSCDGYQREAAVVELVRRADPQAIPVLLVGVGDWVLEVRRAAMQGLAVFMRDEFIAQWAHALPELAFVYRVRRTDLRDLRSAIEDFLARNIDLLEQHAPALDDEMRRWLFTLRLQRTHGQPALQDLLCRAVRSNDLLTALLCLNAADRLQALASRRAVFESASRSRLPRVRMMALRELLSLHEQDARPLLRGMCFDTSAAVRSLAVGALAAERDDISARVKEILDRPGCEARWTVSALHVLHLLEDPQAIVLARSMAQSPAVPLRRLARWVMLAAAQGDEIDEQLTALAADPSPKMRRLAIDHIRRGAPLPSPDALMRMGLERRELAMDVIAMLGSGSPWDRLLFVMQLLDGELPSGKLRNAIDVELDAWGEAMAHSYVQPRRDQATRLAALWDRRPELLPRGFPKEVEYHLRAFRVI
ncbi:HEAT repeat domain-containing protein [Variovorax paradoxus]|uniref:HEAT repeat domain-containing protein n=1 Tax=Variovorax paradoxus TaxID=34073 RepID=UPI003D65AD36